MQYKQLIKYVYFKLSVINVQLKNKKKIFLLFHHLLLHEIRTSVYI